jgi:hypothetical protein
VLREGFLEEPISISGFRCGALSATDDVEAHLRSVCLRFDGGLRRRRAGSLPKLRVAKKPSDKRGTALVTINGKNKVLARNAIQAWPIMEGENALVLVTAPKKSSGIEYRLRFYEGDSRKYRDLGKMNFAATGFSQARQSNGS